MKLTITARMHCTGTYPFLSGMSEVKLRTGWRRAKSQRKSLGIFTNFCPIVGESEWKSE